MAAGSEFTLIETDDSAEPHLFEALAHHSHHARSWSETVRKCITSWRLEAPAFQAVAKTGFKDVGVLSALNRHGIERLPDTPPENKDITKAPCVTDLTEVLAIRAVQSRRKNVVIPHARVIHKEISRLQHHGIDFIGYETIANGYRLLVVEVMASVQKVGVPATVTDHFKQLHDDTLNQKPPERLEEDLRFVHDECSDDKHRNVINGFLVALLEGSLKGKDGQIAIAVLVRPKGMRQNDDWKPFRDATGKIETANIPATVAFYAIECDCSFSELIDKVKQTASTPTKGVK